MKISFGYRINLLAFCVHLAKQFAKCKLSADGFILNVFFGDGAVYEKYVFNQRKHMQ